MSDLLAIKLVQKTKNQLEFKVRIINPDQTHFPYSISFGSMIIDDVENLELAEPLEQTEEEEDNDLFATCVCQVEVKNIKFLDDSENRNYDNEVIDFTEVSEEEQTLFWKNRNKMPEATLVISVDHPRAIEHLYEGLQWNTSAYEELEESDDSYWKNLNRTPFIHKKS